MVTESKPSKADNLNNIRREGSRHRRNKKKEFMKSKIDEFETNSNIKISETCLGPSVTLTLIVLMWRIG